MPPPVLRTHNRCPCNRQNCCVRLRDSPRPARSASSSPRPRAARRRGREGHTRALAGIASGGAILEGPGERNEQALVDHRRGHHGLCTAATVIALCAVVRVQLFAPHALPPRSKANVAVISVVSGSHNTCPAIQRGTDMTPGGAVRLPRPASAAVLILPKGVPCGRRLEHCNIPDRSYPNRHDPPARWTVPRRNYPPG
jgi:hypothetical protein